MRVYLDQIGCRLNFSEMDTLAARLRDAGHTVLDAPDHAQVIVFNSCAVTAGAARTSRQTVRRLHRTNPQARIAVTGCWSTLRPKQAASLSGVALVVENERKDLLHTLLEPWSADFDDPDDLARVQPDGTPLATFGAPAGGLTERTGRTRAFVKVQDGCNNKCTFCIVTTARGAGRSRSVADIVDEVAALVDEGVQEAVLTGVHLGSYGRDRRHDPADLRVLTEALLRETAIPRLRLSSLEPWELADGFFDLWQQWPDRLCPHLHLPLQAGTDAQLRRMARRCTTESFRALVDAARAAIPDLTVTTDIIVGFPGETDADFAAGLAYVTDMEFADAHIFPYSARTGTAAAAFDGQVPRNVKKARSQRMHAAVAQTGRRVRRRFLGTTRTVLWEQNSTPLSNEPARVWSGLTDTYLRVTTVVPNGVDLANRITPTRLDELNGDTFVGTVVDMNSVGTSNAGAINVGGDRRVGASSSNEKVRAERT